MTLLKIDAPKLGEELELLLGVKRTELLLEQFLVRMLTALTVLDILDPTLFKTVYSIFHIVIYGESGEPKGSTRLPAVSEL